MEKLAPRIMFFTGVMFLGIMAVGFYINPRIELPEQRLGAASSLAPQSAYPDDMTPMETVRSWFGVDISAERATAHRAAELRKIKLRQRGRKTYYTRTKGVLTNGS